MTPRALVYVQHLLGIGHLARIGRIARALADAGIDTTVVQGGTTDGLSFTEGVRTVQLTPARVAAEDMSTLLHPDGRPFGTSAKAARRDQLLAELRSARPDILLVEAFPFGRRQMRFELLPLVEEARGIGVGVVASSIRDLLQENRKPGRSEETVDILNRFFDLVLVHGDARLTPLSLTFPLAHAIIPPVRYTGLVGPARPRTIERDHAVVVSAGGGAVGARLLEAAIRARPLSTLANERWLLLCGPNLPAADHARLQALAGAADRGMTLLRSVPDLAAHLAGARLSISQAGYNTVADVLASGCAAVLSPFAAGGETEQTTRAAALAAARRVSVAPEVDLSPERLAAAIEEALALPPAPPQSLDGGARTAELLMEALPGRIS
jgi:predicted glycosyltransferase